MIRFALIAAIVHAGAALAQPYPQRSIEMIIPIAPGGGMDTQARLLADLAEAELKQKNANTDDNLMPGRSWPVQFRRP